jgi:hypothetical protein
MRSVGQRAARRCVVMMNGSYCKGEVCQFCGAVMHFHDFDAALRLG